MKALELNGRQVLAVAGTILLFAWWAYEKVKGSIGQ